jgi:hypothetical protein
MGWRLPLVTPWDGDPAGSGPVVEANAKALIILLGSDAGARLTPTIALARVGTGSCIRV